MYFLFGLRSPSSGFWSADFNLQKGDRALVRTFTPHLLNIGHQCALAYEAEAEINIMEGFDGFSQRKEYLRVPFNLRKYQS
jgi:hypothetical protein